MANSYEIAQMFSQQNSMFMGQNQYAQSIGVPTPPMMNQVGMGGPGLGGYGFSGGGRGPGFNWGQSNMMGYGPGNSISAGMMSGMGAAFSGGSMALGAAGMFGMLGRAGAVMDPLAWGAGASRMMGGGMIGGMAGMGAAALPLAAGMALSHGVQSFVQGGQQQAGLNTMLGSQYQFFNPNSRTGAGFTRDDAKSIGDMARQMSHVPEMMTSFEELTKVMERMKSSGAMQGVRSAADFQSRFREAITTIRETAKVLGTTMEEAEQFFSASRGSGFYGRSSQIKNALSAQFTSGLTGASVGQVAQLQGAGADMAMQFGARRGLGATAVTNIAQNIALAQREGRLSEGAVEDVTGMQGPEAQLALSQRMFSGMMRFGQTAPGRLAMAGMMKFENGRATGVDEDLVRRFNQGNLSIDELKSRAGRLSDKEKISFTARQSDLVASLAGQIGPGGAFGMMQQALGGRGDEATNLVMQRLTGMSAGELDIAQGMQGVSGDGEQGMMSRFRTRQANQRERTDPAAILKRVKTKLHSATFGKLEQMGADVQTSIAKAVDDWVDEVVGREVSTLTEDRAKAIAQAFSGSNSQEAREMLKSLSRTDSKGLSNKSRSAFSMDGAMIGSSLGPVGALIGGFGTSAAKGLMGYLSGSGAEDAYASKLFGTDDISKRSAILSAIAGGKIAGGGAGNAVADILNGEETVGLSDSQRMQKVTSGLQSRVSSALGRLGLDKSSISDAMSGKRMDWLESVLNRSDLKGPDRELLQSFIGASKNRVGGMDVFGQMAAASGLGGVVAGLAGGGGASMGSLQGSLKSAGDTLSGIIGGAGKGLIEGGNVKKIQAFKAAVSDGAIRAALASGDITSAKMLLGEKGHSVSDKDLSEIAAAAKGFDSSKLGQLDKAVQNYSDVSNQIANKEAQGRIGETGMHLKQGAAGLSGGIRGLQESLASELMNFGKGAGNVESFQKSFSAYSSSLQGLKGKELEAALQAGGDLAQQAYSAGGIAKKARGRSFNSAQEAARALGVDAADVERVGFVNGKALSEDQIQKLATQGAGTRGLVGAMTGGGVSQDVRSDGQKMVDAINRLNGNQEKLGTLLATLSGKESEPAVQAILNKMKENSSSGSNGETTPGR